MNPLKKSLTSHFNKKYEKKDYYSRFVNIYLLSIVIGLGCLGWSSVTSYNFYKYLIDISDPFWNMFAAGFLTIAQSVLIGTMVGKVIDDFFRNQWDAMTSILSVASLLLMAWNVYGDFHGVPELAESMTEAKPVDMKIVDTDNVYEKQINEAKASIARYEKQVAYIKGDCKKEDCYVTGGKAYWQGYLTEFGKKELRAIAAKITSQNEEITKITNTWNGQRETDKSEHSANVVVYETKLSRKTGTMRGLVFALLVVFLACTIFRGYFGAKIANGDFIPVDNSTPDPRKRRYQDNAENQGQDYDYEENNGNRSPVARVRPLIEDRPDTVTVAPDTVTVMKGSGFPCTCSHCGEDYFAQRKPREGNNTYCSTECHDAYWREKRKVRAEG